MSEYLKKMQDSELDEFQVEIDNWRASDRIYQYFEREVQGQISHLQTIEDDPKTKDSDANRARRCRIALTWSLNLFNLPGQIFKMRMDKVERDNQEHPLYDEATGEEVGTVKVTKPKKGGKR